MTLELFEKAKELHGARGREWDEQRTPHDYNIQRGMDGYEQVLPKFMGKGVTETIYEKLKTQGSVSILDLGCGSAVFLSEVGRLFSQAQLSGISAFDYRLGQPSPAVDYRVGDLHDLKHVFTGQTFDVITSVYSQRYLANPLSILRQAYSLLKPDGVAFIHEPGFFLNYEQAVALKRYWQQRGIVSCFDKLTYRMHPKKPVFVDLAIQKSTSKLPLPFRYNKPDSIVAEKYIFTLPN